MIFLDANGVPTDVSPSTGLPVKPYQPARFSQKRQDIKVNNVWRRKFFQEVAQANPNFAKTQGCIVRCPAPDFTAVRVGFPNAEASAPTVSAVAFAATNSSTSITTPSTATWVQGSFNGSPSSVLGAAGPDLNTPSITYTDWTDIASVTPTDSGVTTPYLLIRALFSAAFTYVAGFPDTSTTVNTKVAYQDFYRSNVAGDFVSTNQIGLVSQSSSGNAPFYVVEFYSSKGCVRVACGGDSITAGKHASDVQGGSPTYTASGWWQQANDYFVENSIPINLYQNAVGGMTTAQSLIYTKAENTSSPPSIHLYSIFSPNDGPSGAANGGLTQAIMDAEFLRAMNFARTCKANGALPVFTVLAPNNNYSSTDDNFLLALIAKIKASSFNVIDLSQSIVTPGSAPRRFATGAGDSDGIHPIKPGYAIMAASFIPKIMAIVQESCNI